MKMAKTAMSVKQGNMKFEFQDTLVNYFTHLATSLYVQRMSQHRESFPCIRAV